MTAHFCAVSALVAVLAPLALARVPIFFEENKGQTDKRVEFLSRAPGHVLFLTHGDAVLKVKERSIRMQLVGARKNARAAGLDPMPGRSNYLRGGDGSNDVTGISQFARVRYQDVYPGIDLVYYGKDGRLEYDFELAPGADPNRIRLRFDGAARVRVDQSGNLTLGSGVQFDKPVLYQHIDGKRVEVAGAFRLRGSEAKFEVGPYRRDLPLVIDPVLSYSTYLGGSGGEIIRALAVDAAGNAYIGGDTESSDFPMSTGAADTSLSGRDWFVVKLNLAGSALVYATFIGGSGFEIMYDMDVAPDGRVVAVGSSVLSPTPGAYRECCGSTIIRLNGSGTAFEYVALTPAEGRALVAVLPDLTVVVTGQVYRDTTTTPGAYQRTRQGTDSYVVKLNATGSAPVFATYLGGAGTDRIADIATNASGDIFLIGTADRDFPTTTGAYQTSGSAFAAKLKADGSALLYSTRLDGVTPYRLATGPGGDLWVTGLASGAFAPTPGAYLTTPPGPSGLPSGFLVRLNSTGTSAVFSTYAAALRYSGSADAPPLAVAVDSAGEASLAGAMEGPVTPNAFQLAPAGTYIQRFNSTGSILRFATYQGGTGDTIFAGAALDASGNLYVAGSTPATNMPTTPGAYQATNRGSFDGYIAKIDNSDVSCSYTISPTTATHAASASTRSVDVNTTSGCSWVATSAEPWVRITAGASGIGPGVLSYSVDANNSTSLRTGVLTIAGKTFTISQAGTTCTYSIAPTSLAFDAAGGISNVAVTAPQGCTWTVLSNAAWITPATNGGNGTGSAQYTVAPNTGIPRSGTMTVAGQTFTVNQAGSGCTFVLSSTAQNVPISGGAFSFSVTSQAGCSWTVTAGAPWVTITGGTTGSGSAAIQFSVQPNTGAARQTTITVGGQTLTVSQAGSACAIAVSPTSLAVPTSGGTFTLSVTGGSACTWTASTASSSWITITPASGTVPGTIAVTIQANSAEQRSGTILVGQQPIAVTQAAAGGCAFTLGANETFSPATGLSGSVTLSASSPTCAWTASSSRSWMQVFPISGTGTTSLTYSVFPNYTASARSVTLNAAGQTFTITQAAATGTPDELFIGQLYFAAFGRIASSAEIAAHIASGRSRAELVNLFLGVPEFLDGAKFIAGLYVGILGRDGEYAGWMFQRNAMSQSGATPHGLVGNFLNGAEFTLKNGTLSNADFVRLIYRQILGREATPAEVDFQVANLKDRVNLAVTFLTSQEYRIRVGPRLTGFLLHALLLQRDPTPAELDQRAAQIASGTPLTTIINQMLVP